MINENIWTYIINFVVYFVEITRASIVNLPRASHPREVDQSSGRILSRRSSGMESKKWRQKV
jgi:hypothetical protein